MREGQIEVTTTANSINRFNKLWGALDLTLKTKLLWGLSRSL